MVLIIIKKNSFFVRKFEKEKGKDIYIRNGIYTDPTNRKDNTTIRIDNKTR